MALNVREKTWQCNKNLDNPARELRKTDLMLSVLAQVEEDVSQPLKDSIALAKMVSAKIAPTDALLKNNDSVWQHWTVDDLLRLAVAFGEPRRVLGDRSCV